MSVIVGQHIMIGLSGLSLTSDEKKFIVENEICGVTLFGRNVSTPEQVRNLCAEVQSLRHQMKNKLPLFIGIDMEGGRVARLKAPFTIWPPLKRIGDLDSPNLSFSFSQAMGDELRAVGINLDYAPCADVFTNPQNTVIGDRSVSADPEMVAKHVSALIRGYIKSGVVSCVKHFPGHGNTLIDSHLDLPVENANLERLESVEFIPFKKALKSRVPMLMSAHIKFPNIDPEWPATLSEIFLTQIVREKMRFKGIIITDDMGMKAMSAHFPADLLPVRALSAGADILLYCNEPETPPIALNAIQNAIDSNTLSKSLLEKSLERILECKNEYLKNPDPLDMKQVSQIVGHPDHLKIAQDLR